MCVFFFLNGVRVWIVRVGRELVMEEDAFEFTSSTDRRDGAMKLKPSGVGSL